MAKNSSLIKFEGTLDGMTFYKTSNGHLVRTKGGVSKGRIMTDPAYVRTRENINEFATVMHSVKLIRSSLGVLLNRAKDAQVSSRLMSVLSKIKNLDQTSLRGLRKVSEGINTAEGKHLLTGFDFNIQAKMGQILNTTYTADALTGNFSIEGFIPLEHLSFPQGATHVSLKTGIVKIDFEAGTFEAETSDAYVLPINMIAVDVSMAPAQVPTINGITFHLLLIEFNQEINGLQYFLRNGAFNALHILEVQ